MNINTEEEDLDYVYVDKAVLEDQLQDLREEQAQERATFLLEIKKMEQQYEQQLQRQQQKLQHLQQQLQHQQELEQQHRQKQQQQQQQEPQQQASPNVLVQREAGPVRRGRHRSGRSVRLWRERQQRNRLKNISLLLLHEMTSRMRSNNVPRYKD